MLKSKIHRAAVTQADINYAGSATIDAELMEAADILPGEQVVIADISNGARLETYVIEGRRGSGVIGMNGAAARLVHTGDLVIIISYAVVSDEQAHEMRPRIVHVDKNNMIVKVADDPAETLAAPSEVLPDTSSNCGVLNETNIK